MPVVRYLARAGISHQQGGPRPHRFCRHHAALSERWRHRAVNFVSPSLLAGDAIRAPLKSR